MDEKLKVGHWYRINNKVIHVIRYTERRDDPDTIHLEVEGMQPQDYASYITHHFIGENKPPYRTIAEITGIPYPKPINISFSLPEKIEELSKEEALQPPEQGA